MFCRIVVVSLAFGLLTSLDAGEPKTKSSPIEVVKTRLTFDPKTCTSGRGEFYWSYGSCRVEILGREGNDCVFRYIYEQEMSSDHVATIKVPIDSGPVVIEAKEHSEIQKAGASHTWSNVYTSFKEKQVVRMRLVGRHGVEERIGRSDKYVSYTVKRQGDPASQTNSGDKVELWIRVFTDDGFETLVDKKAEPRIVRRIADGDADSWLSAATLDMHLGEVRSAVVPAVVAEQAKARWPVGAKNGAYHLEIEVNSIERK